MKKLIVAAALALAALPGAAIADPPPYDPISICNLPQGPQSCDPTKLPPETHDFVCSIVRHTGAECR